MITFLIGLFIGGLVGFMFAAIMASGKSADRLAHKKLFQISPAYRVSNVNSAYAGLQSSGSPVEIH
jgi:hypothetical protein